MTARPDPRAPADGSQGPLLPCAIALGRRGLAISWPGRYGAGVTLLRSSASLAHEWSRYVTASRHHEPVAPALAFRGDHVVVAFLTADASALSELSLSGGRSRGAPTRLHGDARRVALALDGDDALVASLVPEGAVLARVGADGARKDTTLVESMDLAPLLHVAPARGGALALCATASDPALLVVRVTGSGSREVVRHPLHARVASLSAIEVRGTHHVALAYADDPTRIDVAALDAEGRMIERPHAIRRSSAGLDGAQILFVERGTAILHRRTDTRHARLEPLHARVDFSADVPAIDLPFAAAFFNRQLVVGQVRDADGLPVLLLRNAGPNGNAALAESVPCEPEETASRVRLAAAGALLAAARARLAPGSYRAGPGAAATLEPSGLVLVLRRAGGVTRVSLTVPGDGTGVRLEALASGALGGEAPPPSSLLRLARRLRERLIPAERREAREARAWAETVVGARPIDEAVRGATAAWIALRVDALPTVDELLGWMSAISSACEPH